MTLREPGNLPHGAGNGDLMTTIKQTDDAIHEEAFSLAHEIVSDFSEPPPYKGCPELPRSMRVLFVGAAIEAAILRFAQTSQARPRRKVFPNHDDGGEGRPS